ncbi:MAG: RidA family protein [Thermoanaerobaculaceae bacterium]|nr:RidA family protein [Thermoanaerobaculaceae bacterium]TAM52745.1 MAG: RidA family protein [Acidobacteriota bacterium]
MRDPAEVVQTDAAPKAIGPYSQALAVGGWVFLSGQIPLDPVSGELVGGGFAPQATRALANLDAVLRAAGCERSAVAKVTVYLTDLARFGEFNEIYAQFFGSHRPARAVIGVAALPRGAQVEVEAVAAR